MYTTIVVAAEGIALYPVSISHRQRTHRNVQRRIARVAEMTDNWGTNKIQTNAPKPKTQDERQAERISETHRVVTTTT